MKKRMMGILLALSLCLTLLPSAAFAAYTPPVEVDEVSVSVPAPTLEDGLKVPTVADNAPYFIDSLYAPDDIDMNVFYWNRVAAKGCTASAGYLYEEGGTSLASLVNNSWYRMQVKLLLDYGYVYGESVTGNVPGAELVEVERYKDDAIYLSAWFKVGSPTEPPESVSTISVSDVQTTWDDAQIKGWSDKIQQADVYGDGYRIYDASLQKWNSEESSWNYCYDSDPIEGGAVYGVILHLNTLPGYVFEDTVTAAVNGSTAEVAECSTDEAEVFVPFESIVVNKVEVKSATWPIDGNTIRKDADNFTLYSILNEGRIPNTLKSAQFQIEDGGSYRDLNEDETKFSCHSSYRVIAELETKDYASFADSVTGDFNGTDGVSCEISADKKTCTVTRTCAVYDPVYTYSVDDPNTHINSVTIHQNDPQPGATYADGVYAPAGSRTMLVGVNGSYSWYEVPCVGSTEGIKKLTNTDTFEAGKVYWYSLKLRNADGYRFGEDFTVSFKQLDGSDSKYARMECTRDTAKSKQYNIWYTVGDVTQQAVTNVAITGPAYQNGAVDTSAPSAFHADVPVTLRSLTYNNNYLSFTLLPQSGHYFGRTVTVTYNGKEARVSDGYFSSFDTKYIGVSYSGEPATPITVTGITAKNKTYDGTTSAKLDVSYAVLNDIEAGDDVSLDLAGVTAVFADKNVGTGKTVSVTGQFRLTGKDANKYALTQPARTLTADIAATSFTDATNKTQTIYVGESSFEAPRFTGVTVNGKAEEVTGDTAYTVGGETKTVAEIGEALKTLKAGEHLEISYSFTATDSNYSNDAKPGAITVTAQNRPSSGSSSSPSYSITLPDKTEHGTVTANRRYAERGDTVTITVKPDSGYVLEALTATDRNDEELTLTDLGDGKYTFTMPSGKVEVKATFMEDNSLLNLFYDVPNGAYYYEAVKRAVEKDITNGIGNSLFGPNAPCTRAQIVTFLWRAAGGPEPKNAGSFSDVPSGGYYAKAVAWAAENGITTGVGGGRFAPDDTCTRAQAVALLARALNAKAEGSASFSDVPADSYYAGAVKWAADNGVTEGIGGGLFGPADDCTRAQIVTFLYRAYNK